MLKVVLPTMYARRQHIAAPGAGSTGADRRRTRMGKRALSWDLLGYGVSDTLADSRLRGLSDVVRDEAVSI